MIQSNQDWIDAYKELCDIFKNNLPEFPHLDLWHEQIDYPADEYPWPSDSVFFDFGINGIDSIGLQVQDLNMRIGVIYVLDTFADTYADSTTQDLALQFGEKCKKIHRLLHGSSGVNFSELSRVDLKRLPAPQYQMVYRQEYSCIIRDMSAMADEGTAVITSHTAKKEITRPPAADVKLYNIPGT